MLNLILSEIYIPTNREFLEWFNIDIKSNFWKKNVKINFAVILYRIYISNDSTINYNEFYGIGDWKNES